MAYGKCSPDGCSLRLGGNTSLFFRIIFSCIFQCPSVPPMVVLRSKGGTSMLFVWKCDARAKAKKPSGYSASQDIYRKCRKTGRHYGFFLTFAVLRSGTRIPEIRMTEIKNSTFFVRNEVFWGSGPPWGQVWNRRRKNVIFRAKGLNYFRGHFGTFSVF